MTTTRWDPLRDLLALQERMNRLFEESRLARSGEEDLSSAGWAPPVDIFETDSELVIRAEIPETRKEEIDIKVDSGLLTLKGKREFKAEAPRENYHRIERRYGPFSRSFSLPSNIDADKIQAGYKEGVLTIRIPKRPESSTRHVEIT